MLVTDDELWITKAHGIPEHALLSVSKTVRSETLEIFYLENNFHCEVSNFNHAAIELAYQKKGQLHLDPARKSGLHDLGLKITGQRNWKNVVAWMQMCREKRTGYLCANNCPKDSAEEQLLAGLFAVARDRALPTPEALDAVLACLRPALVAQHADWGKD